MILLGAKEKKRRKADHTAAEPRTGGEVAFLSRGPQKLPLHWSFPDSQDLATLEHSRFQRD